MNITQEHLFLIFGMTLVTYLPRLIPVLFSDSMHFSPKIEKFLQLIPYTAMASLIFPGIFFVDKERIEVGLIGGIVALICAWKNLPMFACIVASIVATAFLLL